MSIPAPKTQSRNPTTAPAPSMSFRHLDTAITCLSFSCFLLNISANLTAGFQGCIPLRCKAPSAKPTANTVQPAPRPRPPLLVPPFIHSPGKRSLETYHNGASFALAYPSFRYSSQTASGNEHLASFSVPVPKRMGRPQPNFS